MKTENRQFKALNFDCDTKKMKEKGVYPSGYAEIGDCLRQLGFEHRQGSGYISYNELTETEVAEIVEQLVDEISWFPYCIKKMDVTDIGEQHDLIPLINSQAERNLKSEIEKCKHLSKDF